MNLSEKEKLILAYMEGDLGEAERKELEALLREDVSLREMLQAFGNTRLQPDATVRFRNKESLLQPVAAKRIFLRPYIIPSAVAASLLLLLGWYFLFRYQAPQEKPTLVEQEKKEIIGIAPTEPAQEKKIVSVPGTTSESPVATREEITKPKKVVLQQEEKVVQSDNAAVRELDLEQLISPSQLTSKNTQAYTVEVPSPEVLPMEMITPQKAEPKKGFSVTQTKDRIGRKMGQWIAYLRKPEINVEKDEDKRNNYTITIYHAAWSNK